MMKLLVSKKSMKALKIAWRLKQSDVEEEESEDDFCRTQLSASLSSSSSDLASPSHSYPPL